MRCKSVYDVKSSIDPLPFWLGRVPNDTHFLVSFEAYKKPKFGKKEKEKNTKKRDAFRTGEKKLF